MTGLGFLRSIGYQNISYKWGSGGLRLRLGLGGLHGRDGDLVQDSRLKAFGLAWFGFFGLYLMVRFVIRFCTSHRLKWISV